MSENVGEPIYKIHWEKYRHVKCFDHCLGLDAPIRRTFHTCPDLMTRKKRLENLVRQNESNQKLKKHFKTKYQNRKIQFYREILYELVDESVPGETEIAELTKDILFIYSKKTEELEYIDDLSNHYEAIYSHNEEMRESMIEDWRGID